MVNFSKGKLVSNGNPDIIHGNDKFDEIVAFSEVEKFIDTPVKRYSSGMYVRLAFAVAAHLDPEIMLVDEVLAVGDSKFQKKCLSKMNQISTSGKTILFVSHNMGTIRKLCHKCVWLDFGRVKMIGDTGKVVEAYLTEGEHLMAQRVWNNDDAPINNGVRLLSVRVLDSEGNPALNFTTSDPIFLETKFDVLEENGIINSGYLVFRRGNWLLSAGDQHYVEERGFKYGKGRYRTLCKIPPNLLNFGEHTIGVEIYANFKEIICTGEIIQFQVFNDHPTEWQGEIRPKLEWTITEVGN